VLPSGDRPRPTFDRTVSLGNVLTMIGGAVSLLVLYGKLAILADHVETLWRWAGFG